MLQQTMLEKVAQFLTGNPSYQSLVADVLAAEERDTTERRQHLVQELRENQAASAADHTATEKAVKPLRAEADKARVVFEAAQAKLMAAEQRGRETAARLSQQADRIRAGLERTPVPAIQAFMDKVRAEMQTAADAHHTLKASWAAPEWSNSPSIRRRVDACGAAIVRARELVSADPLCDADLDKALAAMWEALPAIEAPPSSLL